MKTIRTLATILFTTLVLHAHENIKGGPNGGRVLATTEPHAEFLVTPDHKVQITFLAGDGSPIAPGNEIVTVTTGDRSAPVKLTFSKTNAGLLSDQVLPEGNNLPVVVQIRTARDAKPTTARFMLNRAECPGCSRPEYACTCQHTP